MKRVVVTAVVAAVVATAVAFGVWLGAVALVGATIDAQGRAAADLLAADAPISEALVVTIRRPGTHVVAADRDAGIWVDAGSAGVHSGVGAPPAAGPRAQPPPPPPRPPDDEQPPPAERPAAPDNGPQARLERLGLLGIAAQAFIHHRPVRVERGARSITISPDALEFARWFELDLALLALALGAIAFAALRRLTRDARTQRAELERRATERDEAARRYQRFLAETGHELRTPLTVMAGYVDILRSRNLDEPLDARIIEGMHAETARMRVLVEKMMTLARLESQVTVPRLLDVGTAAREAANTVQRRYPAREIRAVTDATASIVIDADDYAAALINLLENAVKYAPLSPVTVATAVAGTEAITSVTDLGPGISASEQRTIFEPFFRGGDRMAEGLGLGLAIVKRVVDRWNGRVGCESVPGRTTFTLVFPIAEEERDAVAR
jgi:signal transduction histidine kinase